MAAQTSPTELPDSSTLRWMYEHLVLIREFEERVATLRQSGALQGRRPPVRRARRRSRSASARALNQDDYVASTHRGHGHCIAKGVDVRRMMAELYGSATGTNRGKGGSMHIADTSVGMLGATGIVGSGHAAGAGRGALGAEARGTRPGRGRVLRRRRDGPGHRLRVPEHGRDLEAAADLRLREQRLRRVDARRVRAEHARSGRRVPPRSTMPACVVDGQDVFAVYDETAGAPSSARARGEGPTLPRVQDVPLLRPLPGRRPASLPLGRGGGVLPRRVTASSASSPRRHSQPSGAGSESTRESRARLDAGRAFRRRRARGLTWPSC